VIAPGEIPDVLALAWDAALARSRETSHAQAIFNVELLEQLRPRWESSVRPDTSMWTLLFTVPDETGYRFTNRVEVAWQASDRVSMSLVVDRPQRSLTEPGGRAVVTGDFTRPENALPAVEALLWQLAEPRSVEDDTEPAELPEPWFIIPTERRAGFADELAQETSQGHPLWQESVVAVASCGHCDDVVFRIEGCDTRWARVHLTWSHEPEPPPSLSTGFYSTLGRAILSHDTG